MTTEINEGVGQAMQADRVPGCTHRCLKQDGHVFNEPFEPHFYRYELGPHAADEFVPEGYAVVKVGSVPPWMQTYRIFAPRRASEVHHGERYSTIDSHVVEGYSARQEVSPGYKAAGNPVIGPDKTVWIEVEDADSPTPEAE